MTPTTLDPYGTLAEPTTLRIERLLPGPIDRVWAYLTDPDLRRKWLASGPMTLSAGGPLELIWRHDELIGPKGARPEGIPNVHSMQGVILEAERPHLLAFTWPGVGEVTFELQERGDDVLLTLHHRRVPDRATLVGVSAGWHAHLDLLVAACAGKDPEKAFWSEWARLRGEYDARHPQ